MHYVIGDIHNDLKKLKQILKQINITRDDELIVLGDVFDRGGGNADPFGVYCALAGLQGKCSWIRGNHDDWLANYTYEYFNTPEKKRHKLAPYGYNSFELLRQRITEVDMRNIADLIKGLPLQKELELEGKKNVRLVVNRVDEEMLSTVRLTIDDIMDTTGTPLAGVVPEDPNITLAAAFGVPVLAYARRCPAARAFRRIADRLEGITAPIKL